MAMVLDWIVNWPKDSAEDLCQREMRKRKEAGRPVQLVIDEPRGAGGHEVSWWKDKGYVGIYIKKGNGNND